MPLGSGQSGLVGLKGFTSVDYLISDNILVYAAQFWFRYDALPAVSMWHHFSINAHFKATNGQFYTGKSSASLIYTDDRYKAEPCYPLYYLEIDNNYLRNLMMLQLKIM